MTERTTRAGIGAAIVAVEREPNKKAREHFAPSRIFYSVTVIAHFEGRRCVLAFEDPLGEGDRRCFTARTVPLAADFTVPLAVMLQQTDPKKHEISRVLDPEKFAHTAAIERLQPYDPNKTVVLVIHGLMDSQATWTPMINKLRGDRYIRKHYQFWFYSYPSGYPYPYSAAILRQELDAVEKRFPHETDGRHRPQHGWLHQPPASDRQRRRALDENLRPAAGTRCTLSPHVREYFQRGTVFPSPPGNRPRDLHRRAVAWQRSRDRLGRAASPRCSSANRTLSSEASDEMLRADQHQRGRIETKAPRQQRRHFVAEEPIRERDQHHPHDARRALHTIIGDRGRGDSPNSSDGVVPYWSSHLEGAETEHIVRPITAPTRIRRRSRTSCKF